MARLTCAYCNNIIKRSDTKCPHCGAETESSIKKFAEAREAETAIHKERLETLGKSRKKRIALLVCLAAVLVACAVALLVLAGPTTVVLILLGVLALAYVVYLIIGMKAINENYAECRELNRRIDGFSHAVIFDCEDVQPYKMINDEKIPNEGCFKQGLQQIAFKVSITNGSSRKVEFTLVDEVFGKSEDFGYHVRLSGDGVRMEDCKLAPFFDHHEEHGKIFEPLLYTEGFRKIVLRPQESLTGWVAFYVTPGAKDLELSFADDCVTVSNPALSN